MHRPRRGSGPRPGAAIASLLYRAALCTALLAGCRAVPPAPTPARPAAPTPAPAPARPAAPAPARPAAPTPAPTPAPAPPPDAAPDLQPDATPDLQPLARRLAGYIAGLDGAWSVAVIDIPSGRHVAVGEAGPFRTASTYKVPLVMYALDQVARGRARLDEEMRYAADDWEAGTGILQGTEEGTAFRLDRLMELAITRSDNIAANMLIRRFGRQNIWAFESRHGMQVTHDDDGRWVITPLEMARLLAALETGRALPPAERERLLGWMRQTVFTDRLPAGVPADVPVAHKIGTLVGMVHDVGIVYAPGRTFAIAVYSRGVPDERAAAAAIAGLAQIVYNYEVQLAGGGIP